MRRASLTLLLAIWAAAAGATDCRPIDGLDPWLRPGAVLLLGEIHGTAESPAFVADAACRGARSGLPVVVALEQPVPGQAEIDTYLASEGGEEARDALLAGPFWRSGYQDGRASQAMLELIEDVGGLRRSGLRAGVVLFDTGGAGGGQARDRGMADRLAELVAEETEAVTLILTGNVHSRTERGRPGNADFEPMGYLLRRRLAADRVVSLMQAHGNGTAWICSRDCGVTELGGRRGERPWRVEVAGEPPPGHDGWYRIGEITASPPARLSPAERAALPRQAPESITTEPEPAPSIAADPAAPLSSAERSLQGRWQGYDHRRGFRTWTLDVDGRGFRAEGSGEWYEGRLVLQAEHQPAWIDFVIERCRCAYEPEVTSRAVFSRQGEALLVAATSPGNPRPARLDGGGSQLLRFLPR